ncbi:hypothetical protein OH76DRAFT_1336719 [Lentinus brumalis]|uniref:EH domain-containing protein n=1 Tax=Lentinus brumalis TaxID=2498619 RepID=A0A371DV13_9APHY|nr:hypothetical protein OH76DRAFT_1336719 [Polyporus brumalis]
MQTAGPTVVVSRSPPDLLETPISPAATSISAMVPSTPSTPLKSMPPSPSPSPPNLGRKTSLIDLKDWVVDDGPLPYVPRQKPPSARKPPPPLGPKPGQRHVSDSVVRKPPPPLISLESPPKAPPLPPRKPSYASLRSASASNSSSSSLPRSPNQGTPPLPTATRSSSDSLTVDHTYPPLSKLGINIPSRHAPASSISSFHSVSLSSDGGTDPTTPGTANSFSSHVATYPVDRDDFDHDRGSLREPDAVSLDESFENLSVTSAVSPSVSSVSYDWEVYAHKRASEPPKLPQRPTKPPVSAPTSPRHSPVLVPKRDGVPPPPPSRSRPPSARNSLASTSAASQSDRSSIISTATSRTSVSTRSTTTPKPKLAQLTRPTPVPPAARKRYEAVFNGNVLAARQVERAKSPPPGRKSRQAAGWRGLSVDLITNPEENASSPRGDRVEEGVGAEERLDGEIVRAIWKLSRLERATLRVIWMECDPAGTGSLDRDGFVRGMWRIDEELRKAQMHKHLVPRIHVRHPRPVHPSKPILR